MIRSARPSRLTAASLAVAVVVTLGAPSAAGHAPDPIFNGLFGQDQLLKFRWGAGMEPPAWMRTPIVDAASDSNATRASRAARFAFDAAASNPIRYGVDVGCGPNGIACFNRSAPNSFSMGFRPQGHKFDWGTLKWCQNYADPPNGCYDVENVALDEFGHVEVLNHHVNLPDASDFLDAVVQTVSRTKPNAGWNAHAYGRCDVATLQVEYDVPNASTAISTCLDLATTLSLAASATTVSAGSSVTFTATLIITDEAGYKRLGGNALSGRAVSLQRRVKGAASWTTWGSMAAGTSAGTYTAKPTPSQTYEWRALYTAFASEGLESDSSDTVTVTVPTCTSGPCPQSSGEATATRRSARWTVGSQPAGR